LPEHPTQSGYDFTRTTWYHQGLELIATACRSRSNPLLSRLRYTGPEF
jgi:hypothetical protein